jgi:hypothetical protein
MDVSAILTAAVSVTSVLGGLWRLGNALRTAAKERAQQHQEGLIRFSRMTDALESLKKSAENAASGQQEFREKLCIVDERIQQLDRRVGVLETQVRNSH